MARKIQLTFDCDKSVDDLAIELMACASTVFNECCGGDQEAWRLAMTLLVTNLNRHVAEHPSD